MFSLVFLRALSGYLNSFTILLKFNTFNEAFEHILPSRENRLEILFEQTYFIFEKENIVGLGRLRDLATEIDKRETRGENSHQLKSNSYSGQRRTESEKDRDR